MSVGNREPRAGRTKGRVRRVAAAFASAICLFGSASFAAEGEQREADEDGAYVYSRASRSGRRVGFVAGRGRVRLAGCTDCGVPPGMSAVEPFGFVFLTSFGAPTPQPAAPPRRLARVTRYAALRSGPRDSASMMRHLRAGHSIAVAADTLDDPYAARIAGGFIRASDLEVHTPSQFRGEPSPSGAVAFLLRDVVLPNGTRLRRYDRQPVRSSTDDLVVLRDGSVPRDAVRIATRRDRPREVPASAFWVHVDQSEQVLTAYEGARWTFATLVTTGSIEHATRRGTFRVHQKTRTMTMTGDDEDNYLVEDVENVMFFRSGYALHSAYWHDHFGERGSHGCVNLSPADARMLFDWAPPRVPEGWTTVYPRAARVEALWVTVEGR